MIDLSPVSLIWEAFSNPPKNSVWYEHLRKVINHNISINDDIFNIWEKIGFSNYNLGIPYIILEIEAITLLDILLLPRNNGSSFIKSKSEGRRMIKEGTIRVNSTKIFDEKYRFCNDSQEDGYDRNDFIFPGGILKLSCGKNSVICTWW